MHPGTQGIQDVPENDPVARINYYQMVVQEFSFGKGLLYWMMLMSNLTEFRGSQEDIDALTWGAVHVSVICAQLFTEIMRDNASMLIQQPVRLLSQSPQGAVHVRVCEWEDNLRAAGKAQEMALVPRPGVYLGTYLHAAGAAVPLYEMGMLPPPALSPPPPPTLSPPPPPTLSPPPPSALSSSLPSLTPIFCLVIKGEGSDLLHVLPNMGGQLRIKEELLDFKLEDGERKQEEFIKKEEVIKQKAIS
ncbi:uncharacterized protein EDB91DRAFT_1088195 [Suillus paluster]|uniref:uncharacterized protein n=1 Tax=Suillus paluster TaxID=48578 RepID=UPI001B882647|nr:uncharacterized protein EDB91DRAFT_1088195 [Suillus paluster]KAG1722287.1 hypothetical protein EDB91DRAFT_1088195 [Suillus paluster]